MCKLSLTFCWYNNFIGNVHNIRDSLCTIGKKANHDVLTYENKVNKGAETNISCSHKQDSYDTSNLCILIFAYGEKKIFYYKKKNNYFLQTRQTPKYISLQY